MVTLTQKTQGFKMVNLDKNLFPQIQKIMTKEEALQIIEKIKTSGQKIGFTNGVFDLMHLGHLHSFVCAKKECDFLVVGLNTDASVRRYKGPHRPIQDQQTRAMMVASLPFVNAVILFDDDTATPLIEFLHPDVIAKEGYTIDRWPEAQKVIAYGGRAVTLPRLEGYSTSLQVEKMKSNA